MKSAYVCEAISVLSLSPGQFLLNLRRSSDQGKKRPLGAFAGAEEAHTPAVKQGAPLAYVTYPKVCSKISVLVLVLVRIPLSEACPLTRFPPSRCDVHLAHSSYQQVTVLSSDPLAIFVESGDMSTAFTVLWSRSLFCSRPRSTPAPVLLPSRSRSTFHFATPQYCRPLVYPPPCRLQLINVEYFLPLTTCFPSTRNTIDSTLP